jgi:hypothetical protein
VRYSGGRFGRCVGVEAVNALLAKWPAWPVVVGSERNAAGGAAVAGVGRGVRVMGTDAVGVCESCDVVRGPLLTLRRWEGNQSLLGFRLR